MNTLLLLVVSLASVAVCSAGSRGNWASGATADRDPEAPSPYLQPPKGPEGSEAPSPDLQPPKGPEGSEAPSPDLQPPTGPEGSEASRAVAYAQAGRPAATQGPDAVQMQGAWATATGGRPATVTYSSRRGNTRFSVATASTIDGDLNTAAVA